MSTTPSIAHSRESAEDFEVALKRVETELKSRGFGVLANLRVHDILKEKIGVVRDPMAILEVCSPKHADLALSISRDVSLLLPCKIVVRKEGGRTRIDLLKPTVAMGLLMPLPELRALGEEVERSLIEAVNASAGASATKAPDHPEPAALTRGR